MDRRRGYETLTRSGHIYIFPKKLRTRVAHATRQSQRQVIHERCRKSFSALWPNRIALAKTCILTPILPHLDTYPFLIHEISSEWVKTPVRGCRQTAPDCP